MPEQDLKRKRSTAQGSAWAGVPASRPVPPVPPEPDPRSIPGQNSQPPAASAGTFREMDPDTADPLQRISSREVAIPTRVSASHIANTTINTNNVIGNSSIANNTYNNYMYAAEHPNVTNGTAAALEKVTAALEKRHVPEAVWDAQLNPGCMKNTRVRILSETEAWVKDPAARKVCWISGAAGSGKTSISKTVCQQAAQNPEIILGGSFFCSRSSGLAAQRDVRCVIPTLARSLAGKSIEFCQSLVDNIDVYTQAKEVAAQINQLLWAPLLAIKNLNRPILFVIDALDECGGETSDGMLDDARCHEIVANMLDALVSITQSDPTLPVKFLVTSRPEPQIRDTRISDEQISRILRLHTVGAEEVDADIRWYITQTLDTKLASKPNHRAMIENNAIEELAQHCKGLFIVAATALKYTFGNGGADAAVANFEEILTASRDSFNEGAAASLDNIYALILREAVKAYGSAHTELPPPQRLLASILTARMTLSIAALADLVNLKAHRVRAYLSRLHAVVHVPNDDNEPSLRTVHASFGDYLFGRAQGSLRVSPSLGHDVLARGCLRVMFQLLRFNISQCSSSYAPNPKTRPLSVTLSLEYACMQWIYHVIASSASSDFDMKIDTVFRSHFLFWLEVASVLSQVWPAAAILSIAASTVSLPELSKFLRDANAFVSSSYEAISRSASHIYLSALPFAAKDSMIYRKFSPLCTGLISVEIFGIDWHGGRQVMILGGHEKAVKSVAYSPDGRLIASASMDESVRVWNTRTGEETMAPLRSGDGAVRSVEFTPNGKNLAAGTDGGVVCIWSLLSGRTSQRRLAGHTEVVYSVSFSPDGDLLASASADKSVRLWKVETGASIAVLDGHTGSVRAVAFSLDGAMLASGSEDNTARLWDVATGGPAGQPLGVGIPASSVCFSPDSTKLVTRGRHGMIYLWDTQTSTLISELNSHSSSPDLVRLSPDGRSMVLVYDAQIRILNVPQNAGETSSFVLEGHTGPVNSASFSPDGLYIASASDDFTVRIWDAGSGQAAVQPLAAHENSINSVAVSPCGSYIVSGSVDRSVRVWDIRTGEPRFAPMLGHTGGVTSVAVSSDGRLIASASVDETVRLWDAQTGEAVGDPLTGHEYNVNTVAFSPNTLYLASGSADDAVLVWDVATCQPSGVGPMRCTGFVRTVTFSPNGQIVAAGDDSGSVYLWYASTGQSICEPLRANGKRIWSITFTPDDDRIVAGGNDNMARVWDINSREQLLLLEGHSNLVRSVAYSPNGEFICSGSADKTVRLWNAATGALITTLNGHKETVMSVAFTPDGRSVVSCSIDLTIRVWDVTSACSLSTEGSCDPIATLSTATLDENGWLVGPSGELLLWVPAAYRSYLCVPPCRLLIDRHRIVVSIGSSGWHRGDNWNSCWLK